MTKVITTLRTAIEYRDANPELYAEMQRKIAAREGFERGTKVHKFWKEYLRLNSNAAKACY